MGVRRGPHSPSAPFFLGPEIQYRSPVSIVIVIGFEAGALRPKCFSPVIDALPRLAERDATYSSWPDQQINVKETVSNALTELASLKVTFANPRALRRLIL
jgi:hypothetical protein